MIQEVKIMQEFLISMIDHDKKNRVQKPFASQQFSVGGILGRVDGSSIKFEKNFQVAWSEEDNGLVNEKFLFEKNELEKQVNGDLDLLGFYLIKVSENLDFWAFVPLLESVEDMVSAGSLWGPLELITGRTTPNSISWPRLVWRPSKSAAIFRWR